MSTLMRTAQPKRAYAKPAVTAQEAARRIAKLCNDTYAFMGVPGSRWAIEQAVVHIPKTDGEWGFDYGCQAAVYWEGGPYDALWELTGWQDAYELLNIDKDRVFMELGASFVLCFYEPKRG